MEEIKDIIDKSISNFVYIDDRVCNPFEKNEYFDSTKTLFNEFHNNNMNIKIIQFDNDFRIEQCEKLFQKNDILILDWKLDGEEFNPLVIDILDNAIEHDDIKYVFIYTDFDLNAKMGICASYHKYEDEQSLVKLLEDNEKLSDLDFSDDSDLFNKVVYEYYLDFQNHRLDQQSFIFKILEHLDFTDEQEKKQIERAIKKDDFFHAFLTLIKQKMFNEYNVEKKLLEHNKHIQNINDHTLRVNKTNISVVKKETGSPQNLIEHVYSSLSNTSDSFFSILNHEVLYTFKKDFYNKAKDISHINDSVIIDKKEKNELEEFIEGIYSDIFKSTIRNNEIKMLSMVDTYFEGKTLIKASDDEVLLINNTSSINFSKCDLENFYREKISFGDIFELEGDEFEYKYAICITPHCDCLKPKKIDYMYSFVFTNKDTTKLKQNMDDGYYSFIKKDDTINVLDWKNGEELKPKTLEIHEHNIKEEVIANYGKKEIKLRFIAQQKENFTQRLANDTFQYPSRVGITFVGKQI